MRYLIAITLFFFVSTANASGFGEQNAWNFLSPLDKQFNLNSEMLRLQEEGGMFEARDNNYIIQNSTNIGNVTNITGDGNNVDQDNSGDQNASNGVESDEFGNLTYIGGGNP